MNSQTRLILSILLVIIVIGAAISLYFFTLQGGSSQSTATATSSTNSATSGSNAAPASSALHITEHATYYDINMQYPASTPLAESVGGTGASANAAAVQAMKQFAQDTIVTFKKDGDFANITPQDAQIQGLNDGQKYALSDEYKTYSGAGTITYLFTIYEDTLGAHPNTTYKSFTFDANTGKQLLLADLFLPNSEYLNTLSTLSRKALVKQQGDAADEADFIDPGTTPDADNFADFAIDGNNLTLFFAPYQVASYAQGPQTVRIPLSQIANILKSVYSPQ